MKHWWWHLGHITFLVTWYVMLALAGGLAVFVGATFARLWGPVLGALFGGAVFIMLLILCVTMIRRIMNRPVQDYYAHQGAA